MRWPKEIEDSMAKIWPEMAARSTPRGATVAAYSSLVKAAADDVERELDADCDPPALARRTARLALLLAHAHLDGLPE